MGMSSRVLIVDDDQELTELLGEYLQADGFIVDCAHDGRSGIERALSGHFDIVVLDVMMPGLNGIQLLGQLRGQSEIPVLMLTARGDDTDRIVGLELGADDYVAKPCKPRELAARLRAILKRSGDKSTSSNDSMQAIEVGSIVLWPARRLVERHGQTLELTSTEFSLLEVLARQAGSPVSKEQLSRDALGRPLSRFDRSIDVHISSMRQKLGLLPDGRSVIQTVIRKGYLLVLE